ncbi:MAG: HlyD family type I secretion periplasmic adaptor subunit [Sulfuricurvum sp.]|uniref:HlyD family type I secretion periplasmic adaptor subunit n=1 Tax=Sulfuricurvum sp. TaxID=2025608 RepID=UPI0026106ED3|nr:HlyD family type I secretion periplasmic adaptor subunit [Sulfuricurvum sp.]MDD2784866.1 HlyD family type I secretion periplasmic adaptor subunit [Sulfuricurvum sp.]
MSQTENVQLVLPETPPSPQTEDRHYRRLGLIVLRLLVGVFGVWSAFAPLSSAVAASGKVSVASSNRMIQHLDGGIVKAILVKDGDTVKVGQELIELDSTQANAQLQIILSQYYENLGTESRLIAERDGKSFITFSPDMDKMQNSAARTMIMEAQRREFTARAQQLIDEKQVLTERIEQLHNQVDGLEATIASKSSLSNSYDGEIKEWEVLYQQQLIDKMRLRDVKREKVRTDGDIANAKAEIGRAKAQISEVQAQMIADKQKFIQQVVSELSDVQAKLSDNRARLFALQDTLKRTKMVAPVEGIVTNLQIHTIGGVVPSGKPVMEIVPEGEPLIIDARIAATDIVNVHVGLKAEIRFPGFSHIKSLNTVMGEVIQIAPDTVVDETTKSLYYPAQIRVTAEGQKELLRNHLSIQPGIPAEVMIVVASRTFLDYIIHPFKYMAARAFNEQ